MVEQYGAISLNRNAIFKKGIKTKHEQIILHVCLFGYRIRRKASQPFLFVYINDVFDIV